MMNKMLTENLQLTTEHLNKNEELQKLAQKHLVMHFTPANAYGNTPPTLITHGEGCWIWDGKGKRYLDALAGLFCVQIGYGRGEEIGEAIKQQMSSLPYYTNWGYVHEPAIKLAAKVAGLAPEGMDRVFFTSSGSESNESAIKLVRQYHQANGNYSKIKFIARRMAYHGVTFGALSINGVTDFRKTFEPLMYGARHVSNTKRYQRPRAESEAEFTQYLLAELEAVILQEGADTVAAIFMEPLQNAGGSLTPPKGYFEGIRKICDKYDILLVADEVICGFGRLGKWFGSTRYNYKPDIITFAKGIGSGYVPLGGLVTTDKVIDTVLEGPNKMFLHGLTYGGSPSVCAAGLANIAILENDKILENVQQNESYFRDKFATLLDLPYVGDLRGDGYHYTLELVTNKETRNWQATIAAQEFAATKLTPALLEAGVICRAAVDLDGNPLLQFSPPLILDRTEIDWLVDRVGNVIEQQLTKNIVK